MTGLDPVTDQTAAAIMLKGMTSQYLIRRTYPVRAGETVLFHAAAGGVGLIACQWLKALGATVIGTVGSDEKAAIARAHGCDHVIVSTREDIATEGAVTGWAAGSMSVNWSGVTLSASRTSGVPSRATWRTW